MLHATERAGNISMTFEEPGDNWGRNGVETGAIFFEGTRECNVLKGRRYAYSAKCPQGVPFEGSAQLIGSERLRFSGASPVRLSDKCKVGDTNAKYDLEIRVGE